MMRKRMVLVICVLQVAFCVNTFAQRRGELLNRGIVALPKSGTETFVSWRHLASDPDDTAYNLYYKTAANGVLTKLNASPITNSTNYLAPVSAVSRNVWFVVKEVRQGVETETAGNSCFIPKGTSSISHIVQDIDFAPIPGVASTTSKYVWPADLDGDGAYEYVVDRHVGTLSDDAESDSDNGKTNSYIEAYRSDGTFLWRVYVGPNVGISDGHSDQVTAFDMDGDGCAEVLLNVSEGSVFADGTVLTGADGTVTDFWTKQGSEPQWVGIVNGQTGCLVDTIPVPFQKELATQRTDKWKHLGGHFIICYLDGIHPSLVYEYKNRQTDGRFTGAFAAWNFAAGKLHLQWANLFNGIGGNYESSGQFHQVRAADVDGDGCDELVEGGFVLDHTGKLLNYTPGVGHGDRHCLADIDPDRPGLEHFFIQQNNSKTLGMGISDAETGELIKGIYMNGVGDVGRGICGAFDMRKRGMQFFSTMNGNAVYDCKGKEIEDASGSFPSEALWWGANLSRRHVARAGSANPVIDQFRQDIHSFYREYSLYKDDNGHGTYYFHAPNGGRAAFWGDLFGDWREELVYIRSNHSGFVVLTTWDVTDHRQYSLMQNPAYRCQTTAKGYYQTADVDFYMASDMPNPPVPPVLRADLYYTPAGWADYEGGIQSTSLDGKSLMVDMRGASASTLTFPETAAPKQLLLMNPRQCAYTLNGVEHLTGPMEVVKSMQGSVTFNGDCHYTGCTRISEGKWIANGTVDGPVRLDARGVLAGNATLNDTLVMEQGLNVEGGRLEPGNGTELGVMRLNCSLTLPNRNCLAFDIDQTSTLRCDHLYIEGDLLVHGGNHILVLNALSDLEADTLTLVTFTGTTNCTASTFKIQGIVGIACKLEVKEHTIQLIISGPRTAGRVYWKGNEGNGWNYQTVNFLDAMGEATNFVPGDTVVFNEEAVERVVVVDETLSPGELRFEGNGDFTLKGDGVLAGTGGLTQRGRGKLSMFLENNSFTGPVAVDGGTLVVASLNEGGLPSSMGASSSNATNWTMSNATLQMAGQMFTNRNMMITDTLRVNNPSTSCSLVLAGSLFGNKSTLVVNGAGTLTLQGQNTLGAVVVNSGVLQLGSKEANKQSLGSATVTLNGGTLRMFDVNSTSYTGPFTNAIVVPEGAKALWDLPSRWVHKNKVSGQGSLTMNCRYVRNDINTDFSAFTGTLTFTGSDVRLYSNTARDLSHADVVLGVGTTTYTSANNNVLSFGSLGGNGAINGGNSVTVGLKGTNSTYSGVISTGTGKLTKVGSGTFTLSGANLYKGGTVVEEGMLVAACTTGSAVGPGSVTVKSGACLAGVQVDGNVTLQNGAVLMAGTDSTAVGSLQVKGNVKFESGARLLFKKKLFSVDALNITGDIDVNGAVLEIHRSMGTWRTGDELQVFTVGGLVDGEFAQIVPAVPAEGLCWDVTDLYTQGRLRVALADAIAAVTEEEGETRIYDGTGRKVASAQQGIYIINGQKVLKYIGR